MIIRYATVFMLIIYACGHNLQEYAINTTSETEIHGNSGILSRRKRFLVFSEGSSLQLVFCNTFPAINRVGDIIQFGYTAALAFELPQDPYSPFDHHADPLHRRVDNKEIYYLDEDGRIIHKRPYKRKFIVNPAFAKRSVDSHTTHTSATGSKKEQYGIDRKQMHGSASREFLKGNRMGRRSVEFHRTSRALLYRKIETLLRSLGSNGKECLLKTLCLVRQTQHHPQGSFFEEILRATFTFPESQTENEDLKEYDDALLATEPCENLFPGCKDPVEGPESALIL